MTALDSTTDTTPKRVSVPHPALHDWVRGLFTERGMSEERAELSAAALCHGDLCGFDSHGVFNLSRLYLPLFDSGRVDPRAEPSVDVDLGACVRLNAHRALGLHSASEAMELAADRAEQHGIGLVAVHGGTHCGCAGFHAARAAERGLVGVLASNCGQQRIVRPPGGLLAMLGTNPLSVAAPALPGHPFVLDMSTSVVPSGKVRLAAHCEETVPDGWLADDTGSPVRDAHALDAGTAHLPWLGGAPETGAYKGFGLGLVVELLAGVLTGSGLGPGAAALDGSGGPHGRDDDIGFFALAIAPELLRPNGGFVDDAREIFATLLACPPVDPAEPVHYPGWLEAERARQRRDRGVELRAEVYRDLVRLGFDPEAAGA